MIRLQLADIEDRSQDDAIPFPDIAAAASSTAPRGSAGCALNSLETVSRRMEDLARELGCLGYFDDDDDRPRAA